MAEWKKVIVSGSSAHLSELKVGSNQLITNSQATTSLTGSFTGSFSGSGAGLTGVTATASFPTTNKSDIASTDKFFINDDAGDATSGNKKITYGSLLSDLAGTNLTVESTDSLTLATTITGLTSVTSTTFVGALTGNASTVTTNANLTGNVTSAGNVTTIATGVVTSAMIANDTITNEDISPTAAIAYSKLNLAGSTIHSGSFFNGITVVSGSAQVLNGSGVFSGSAQLPAGIVSGSSQVLAGTTIHSGSFFNGITVVSGSAQISYTGLTNTPAGIVSGSSQILAGSTIHSGSFFNGITVVSGSSQISYTGLTGTPVGIVSSSVLSSPGQGQALLTTNGGGGGTIDLGLDTTDSPTFVGLTLSGDLAVNGADITTTSTGIATLFNTNATTVNIAGGATAINIGGASSITTINNDTRIKGTLYVDGPVTAISSSNLYVADKFILLASGSTAGTDGGIIVQNAGAGTGFAFGYDTTDTRWVYQNSLSGSATNFGTITAYANTTQYGAANTKPSDATGPAYGAGTGYGNTWVSTDTSEIWIYA